MECDFAWGLTRELVRIDSSDPGAYEGEIEAFLRGLVEERLVKLPVELASMIEIRELEVLPGRFDLMVCVPGLDASLSRLVFSCHMDTVTLGEGWDESTPPLAGVVVDERLYGRGACDMKSGLACALAALFEVFDRIAVTGALPKRSFALLCSVDEEDQMRGIEAAIDAGWVDEHDWMLDTEPTDGQIQVAHKGRTWFEITMEGVTAHASQPWEGADANAAMAEVIRSIRLAFKELPEHSELGKSTVTFGQMQGGYQPYVVPDQAKLWVDMRLVPPANASLVEEMVKEALAKAEQEVPGCKGSYRITGDRPAIERDSSSPLLAALVAAVREATGAEPEVSFFTGYTDTAVVAANTGNKTCLSYGPGMLRLAHKPNEYVDKVDVRRVQKVLATLVKAELW